MWTRTSARAATVALAAVALTLLPRVAAGQQDSAQADLVAWAGQWLYRAAIESARQDMTGRITFEIRDGKLIGDMDEEGGARRWRIQGVRVEHNRLMGVATQTVGSVLPEGTPGTAEDYRVLEIQLKVEGGDRFTGSLRARLIRGSLEGRRP